MVRDNELQHYGCSLDHFHDFGYAIFENEDSEVEISTHLSKVKYAMVIPVAATANTNPAPGETFYIADAVSATTGYITVASNNLTIGRTGETFSSSTSFSADSFTLADIVETVLFTAPFAMTVSSIVFTNSATAWTTDTSVALDVGFADATPTDLVNGQTVTITAYASTTCTLASTAIAAGAKVACLTEAGTQGAVDSALTVNATRVLSTAPRVFYHLIGYD